MSRASVVGLAAVALLAGTGPGAAAGGGAKAETPVAVVGSVSIGSAQLDELARDQLARVRAEEYNVRKRVLDQQVEKLLLEQEAASRKVTVEELLRTEIEAKVKPVTEAEVQAFYEGAKDRMTGVAQAQAFQQIRENLGRQRLARRRAELVSEVRSRRGVRVFLEPPRVAVEAEGPSKGPKDAPVTIVEFSDFQCPFCSRVVPTLKQVQERYGEKVRVVFRDFPLPFHAEAGKAAEAAACAEEQGRFWEMHDALFANQKSLQVSDLKRYAAELGLAPAAFNECLDSGRQQARWQGHREAGTRYGVAGTPAFFVNGRPLSGAQAFDAFAQVIDEELERTAPASHR
jgi:protein-disulfide isomerase